MIEFKHIELAFNQNQLFQDFNLFITKHKKVLLNAPSGSGKTTLLKLALGFIKADSGDIIIDGVKLSPKTLKQIRKKIAYVSQDVDFHNQIVKELLADIFTYKINKGLNVTDEDIEQLFASFHIKHVLTKHVDDLSGGERQRLGLAVALLLDRPILLLDEVTSGLDQKMKEIVINNILKLNKTIIIISHDELWKAHSEIKVVEW